MNVLKKKELEGKVEELEHALAQVKGELAKIEEQEQHDAIDNLDGLMKQMDNKWENIRDFWPFVVEELHELMAKYKKS